MSTKAPKMDIGSLLFLLISLAGILFVVYFLLTSLVNTYKRNSIKGEASSTHLVEAAADNLKPIGATATSDAVAAAPAAARSGADVYGTVCSVCHKTGVAGAPKVGDKAAWDPRVATGLDALINTAINGKGAMPARGGNPSVTDEELKAAILYMTKETGFNLGGDTTEVKKEAKVEAKKEEKKSAEEVATSEPAEAPAAPKEPESPKKPSMETAEVAAVATTAAAAAVATTTKAAAKPAGDGAALYKAKGCGACHGENAMTPIMPLYPKIAGQGKVYVTTQMTDIKSGKRSNSQSATMKGVMAGVSEAEITAIADYLSSL